MKQVYFGSHAQMVTKFGGQILATNLVLYQTDKVHIEIFNQIEDFFLRKCISKCSLQNVYIYIFWGVGWVGWGSVR